MKLFIKLNVSKFQKFRIHTVVTKPTFSFSCIFGSLVSTLSCLVYKLKAFAKAKLIPSFLLKISPLSLTFVAVFCMIVHTFILPIFMSWVASLALFISLETNLFKEIFQHFKVYCADVSPTAGSTDDQEWEDPSILELSEAEFKATFLKLLEPENLLNQTDILNTCDLFENLSKKAEDFHVFEAVHPRTMEAIRENADELIKLVCSAPADRQDVPVGLLSKALGMDEEEIFDEYLRLSNEAFDEATSSKSKDHLSAFYDKTHIAHEDLIYKITFANAQDTGNFEGVSLSSPGIKKSFPQVAVCEEEHRDIYIKMIQDANMGNPVREPFGANPITSTTMTSMSEPIASSGALPDPNGDTSKPSGLSQYLPSWGTVKTVLKTTALICVGGVVVYFVGKEAYSVVKQGVAHTVKLMEEQNK